jgi:uncharacterized membrane protein YheB (UPF0754 family)
VTSSVVAIGQSWSDIKTDVAINWFIYLSMPIVAAFVGYTTKLLALLMLYHPIDRFGIGPIGWQGIVPRRAGKTASVTIQMLTEEVLKPEELLEKVDAQRIVEDLRIPIAHLVDELARELIEEVRPGLWDSLPVAVRDGLQTRVREVSPALIDNLVAQVKADLPRFLDIQYLAVTVLVQNKAQLNKLMQGMAGEATKFIRRSGIYFGFAIGLLQTVAWAYFQNPWIMPAFGFLTGFMSDWLALNLIFIPRTRRKILGLIPIHGVLHAQREQVTHDYARLLAGDLFSASVLIDALLNGPASERLFVAIEREVASTVDAEAGWVRPVLTLAIGTKRYRNLKAVIVRKALEKIPDTMEEAKDYASSAVDLEKLIIEKMNELSDEQYEMILRPIFKDDEMLMVMFGAVLGFMVGEIQVLLVEHFAR